MIPYLILLGSNPQQVQEHRTYLLLVALGRFYLEQWLPVCFLNGSIDNWGGVFPIGWVIGLVGIISGIVGLSMNHKTLKTNLAQEGKNNAKKIKRRSIAGIIFGVIGIGITIIMIVLDAAFV